MHSAYPDIALLVGGQWRRGDRQTRPVLDPATGQQIGAFPVATATDVDDAANAAAAGFEVWKRMSAYERSAIMRRAAGLLRARAEELAPILTREQGKPLAESRSELSAAPEIIEWMAEEARRTYGRIIPARDERVTQSVVKAPIGPVAAFSPWNYPVNQAVRKVAAALAAGCSIVLKGPEETPASCMAMVEAFEAAGVPPGVINLLFGNPADISAQLIPHPAIRKISFTGSTAVGSQLAALSARHLKRATMELGGHAPVILFEDANVEEAARVLAATKFRNAGQVCMSPTRFLVARPIYARFVEAFTALSAGVVTGSGLEARTQMGPLAHAGRVDAIQALVGDARTRGASVTTGGARLGNEGYFFAPTVLADVTADMRAMSEEPFGPLALIRPFEHEDEAFAEANRLDYGLAAYAFTPSAARAASAMRNIESGMVSVNHNGLVFPEVPFGGIKHSGDGKEGGAEAIEPYLITRFFSHLAA